MDKILIEVFLPAANKNFEVYIPLDLKFHEVTFLVSKILSDLSNVLFSSDDNSVLCEIDTGNILNINMSAKELKLKNGSKLMLL